MTFTHFKGSKTALNGKTLQVGDKAPDFILVGQDLKNVSLKDFSGKKKILSVVPSLDTGVCLQSTHQFNKLAQNDPNLLILVISCDLPFAQKRICDLDKLDKVKTLSLMRNRNFAKDYGLLIQEGPLEGLCARAVVILDEKDRVKYIDLVPEITQEPNYQQALDAYKH